MAGCHTIYGGPSAASSSGRPDDRYGAAPFQSPPAIRDPGGLGILLGQTMRSTRPRQVPAVASRAVQHGAWARIGDQNDAAGVDMPFTSLREMSGATDRDRETSILHRLPDGSVGGPRPRHRTWQSLDPSVARMAPTHWPPPRSCASPFGGGDYWSGAVDPPPRG
jgi:hypothetical protein